jgi:anhydro-N-acetylmuramic acid kinase
MAEESRLIAGAMSGTSADGVDVAVVRVGGQGPTDMSASLIRHHHRPYDAALRRAIFALRGGGQVALSELSRVGREISLVYAACVNEALVAAGVQARDVAAVAAHGQTLYHAPPDTIQWLDPALIAAETGCAIVSDFRRADCAAGGQGAPLVPFADYVLFRDLAKNRVLLNIGGIANLTCIPAGATIDQMIAFDTGPGNCVSDYLVRTAEPDGPGYDADGARASAAEADAELFEAVIDELTPYLNCPPPKSTDVPSMVEAFTRARAEVGGDLSLDVLLATASAVTAFTIFTSLEYVKRSPYELVVSGGGARNRAIMADLRLSVERFGWPVRTCDELGVPSEAKEAMAFALLGAATLDDVPSNVPACTGARRRVVLGSVTPYHSGK